MSTGGGLVLSDIGTAHYAPVARITGPDMTPEQRIHFYSPDDWEEFILEYVRALSPKYAAVKRMGGPGDRGVDVAAFWTEDGFEGEWDCYQGKHYQGALTFKDAYPEIVKILKNAMEGHYLLPNMYAFMAPMNCANSLDVLLSKPTVLKQKVCDSLADSSHAVAKTLGKTVCDELIEYAQDVEFNRFKSIHRREILLVHSKTPFHAARFGTHIPPRPKPAAPPSSIHDDESTYIKKLLDTYNELHPGASFDTSTLPNEEMNHLSRQRTSFYKAESLRMHARDAVPDGTYELLADDVRTGIIDLMDRKYDSGFERLNEVLIIVGQLNLDQHTLISISTLDDRKGICHQLANDDDQVTWVKRHV